MNTGRVAFRDAFRPAPGPASGPSRSGLSARAAVVICCYTQARWDRLCAAIASVGDQGEHLELAVVVDHNDDLLKRLVDEFPAVTVVANTGRRGLSGARNTGVEQTGAPIVLFLDDDAEAGPGWAAGLIGCFGSAEVMAAGGRVEPRWEGAAPAWFPAEFGWVVGCSYTGQPSVRAAVRNPIGASMAVRRDVFEQVGGFSGVLGRVGALPVGCEETELCIRAAAARPDALVLLEPASVVAHHVPASRQRVRYVISRCYHEGRSKAALARLASGRASLGSEQAYVRDVLPAAVRRHAARALRGSGVDAKAAAVLVGGLGAAVAGYLSEGVRLRLRGRAAAEGLSGVTAPRRSGSPAG